MKKNKLMKTASVTLAMIVSSSALLTACSTGKEAANTASTPGSGATAAASAKPAGPKPKITVSIYDRNAVPEGEGTITNNRWTKWINENAPVQVEFIPVPRSNSIEKFNVMFASGGAPDLIMEFSNPYMKDLASKGQIIPLEDAISKYSTTYKKMFQENQNIQKLTKFNGKTYFFGRTTPFTSNHFLMIRKDWLDKLKLPMPTTTEEYLKVAKAFTDQDPDGNGKKDTLGTTFWDVDYFFQLGQASDELMPMSSITSYHLLNDQYTRTWDRPKADLAFKKSLYDAGAVDKDIFADKTGAKAQQDWVNGKLGIWGSGGLEGASIYTTYESFKKNNPNAEVAILPLPKSEFGQFSPAANPNMQFVAGINATAKNVEAVVKYVDWLMSPDVQKTLMFGVEGVHYKVGSDGCPKPIDAEKNKKELSWNGDFQMMTQTGSMGKCVEYSNQLDPNKPLDKEYLNLITQARAAYITPDRPNTTEAILPVSLPDDMTVIKNTLKTTLTNTYTKAIVSGASYSVDQAMKDAQDTWEKGGGKGVDEFLKKAYTDNKNDVIFTKDYYKYLGK
ncbi:extracellular solute-binding protein [Paenibacillus chondroitinus]|uniref:Extracellular solute-binding protein n=1 Tax=Paenibacillus chondroitinus TaxID=59842 RepID=A0ABU6D955_9BACL|nr:MULTISPECIES: extracellular solute-binding protein [Paenibacillus]MCY9656631.1 extracellular solute-binding protein [Paenibacillus anseongense]MEB4794280.1 extracellular solute-binding protein [Paenibacillus chondroitinus]